jgi:DNA repair protein RecO (recombination protein O)
MNKYTGFLLSYIKYGDNDAILHCYTQESGFQSFFIKGLYSTKNKKKAFLSPMNELSFTVLEGNHQSELLRVTKLEIVETKDDFTDVKYNTIAFFVSEFLNQILRNENQNSTLYQEIFCLKAHLNQSNYFSHYYFMIKTLAILGLAPLISDEKYLNIEKGVFQEQSNNETIDEFTSGIWKTILTSEFYSDLKIESKYKKKLLDSILIYYKYHFPDFRSPKSLEIINQIFE